MKRDFSSLLKDISGYSSENGGLNAKRGQLVPPATDEWPERIWSVPSQAVPPSSRTNCTNASFLEVRDHKTFILKMEERISIVPAPLQVRKDDVKSDETLPANCFESSTLTRLVRHVLQVTTGHP